MPFYFYPTVRGLWLCKRTHFCRQNQSKKSFLWKNQPPCYSLSRPTHPTLSLLLHTFFSESGWSCSKWVYFSSTYILIQDIFWTLLIACRVKKQSQIWLFPLLHKEFTAKKVNYSLWNEWKRISRVFLQHRVSFSIDVIWEKIEFELGIEAWSAN